MAAGLQKNGWLRLQDEGKDGLGREQARGRDGCPESGAMSDPQGVGGAWDGVVRIMFFSARFRKNASGKFCEYM